MLMKWTDLDPGDVIRFTSRAAERFREEDWADFDAEMKLTKIEEREDTCDDGDEIRFYFKDKYGFESYIYTDRDGEYCGVTLFEIVKLAGD